MSEQNQVSADSLDVENSPLVSVITPASNAERFIQKAIDSVVGQSYTNWEMVICNDGSTDRTGEIIRVNTGVDQRISCIDLSTQSGPGLARREALRNANGRFVAFLDADDYWDPEKLEIQVDFMLKNDVAVSFGQYRRVSEDETKTGRLIEVPEEVTFATLLRHNDIANLTSMVDLHKTGPLDIKDHKIDDYILWLEIAREGHRMLGIQQDLARYRIHKKSHSGNRLLASTWRWEIYRSMLGMSLGRSAALYVTYLFHTVRKYISF